MWLDSLKWGTSEWATGVCVCVCVCLLQSVQLGDALAGSEGYKGAMFAPHLWWVTYSTNQPRSPHFKATCLSALLMHWGLAGPFAAMLLELNVLAATLTDVARDAKPVLSHDGWWALFIYLASFANGTYNSDIFILAAFLHLFKLQQCDTKAKSEYHKSASKVTE